MNERKALIKIAKEFDSMCIDYLSVAERHVLKYALDALNWRNELNTHREICLYDEFGKVS